MSGVFPPPPSPPGECVPPAFGTGGGHPRWVERGWGVNILEDARHSSVLYIFQYFVGVAEPRVLNSVPSSLERTLCVSKDFRSRISTSGSQRFFRMCRLMAVRLGASGACCITPPLILGCGVAQTVARRLACKAGPSSNFGSAPPREGPLYRAEAMRRSRVVLDQLYI